MNADRVDSLLDEFLQLPFGARSMKTQRNGSRKPGEKLQFFLASHANPAVGALAEWEIPVAQRRKQLDQVRKQLNASSSGDAENWSNKAESSEGLGFKTKLSL